MKIAIIGSGNVAYHLALAFHENHFFVSQIIGRNKKALEEIHQRTGFAYEIDFNKIKPADVYIIAVKDDSISESASKIKVKNTLVLHTAGSVSLDVIPQNFRRGVIYPLQTFSKNKKLKYNDIPFFIETENEKDKETVMELAQIISPKVMYADESTRNQLHLSAVFACNFTNHLFAIAEELCHQKNIPFEYLLPLISETTEKIKNLSPKDAQTGPARRNDLPILKKHISGLDGNTKKIYEIISQNIIKTYH